MHPIAACIRNPVKVAVGVLLIALFGCIALFAMPMQLTPEVEIPTITVETRWPGATPHEVEKDIILKQEEFLASVEGVTKMISTCSDSLGSITMEFPPGTDLDEAIIRVNAQLQLVPDYDDDVENPVIRTKSANANAIAWFILSAKPASEESIRKLQEKHPELRAKLERVLTARNPGLAMQRLRTLAEEHEEVREILPSGIDVPKLRKFAEDYIEAEFERVSGVANSNVLGGREKEMQVILDPHKLAARHLTITDVRDRLRAQNVDISGGDVWEGKRSYGVRTLGQFKSAKQIGDVVLAIEDGQPVYIRDVAVERDAEGRPGVRLGFKKPDGFVRRFGITNIAINAQRETGANVIDVMDGLKAKLAELNEGRLSDRGLVLTQVYDETDYIHSAVGLVNQNIILGSALTIIVLMLFLHLNLRTLIFTPLLAISAVLALVVSPWFFLLTLALILVAGFWFARGALVIGLAIPTSIIGTFLLLEAMGRSLNVISLAGLAFAVGMLVDNAVVVLENVYRHWKGGERPFEAAAEATKEVWGAVFASTLTTLAVFLPVVFMQDEAGQLFRDIALAISCAVGLSLLVSITVIPTASARILTRWRHESRDEAGDDVMDNRVAAIGSAGSAFVNFVVGINRWIQDGLVRRLAVLAILVGVSVLIMLTMMPQREYLPTGNRNLVICIMLPPPGYNVDKLNKMGAEVEAILQPYWDVDVREDGTVINAEGKKANLNYPVISDFFYVARSGSVFLGLRAEDPANARHLIGLVDDKLRGRFPGMIIVARQSSLFQRGLGTGRTIDVEITGPELTQLVQIGGRVMGQVMGNAEPNDPKQVDPKREYWFPKGTQARPEPSLDLSNPELHVVAKEVKEREAGLDRSQLGYTVSALTDGAYVADYYTEGRRIDLVVMGDSEVTGHTQELGEQYIATKLSDDPVRLDSIAEIKLGSGPEQILRRERERAITIQVTPPETMPLEEAIRTINSKIVGPMEKQGVLSGGYKINLSGTADKLDLTWKSLRWNLLVAVLITYLLMAALFESWVYPLVIIFSVLWGAVGGILGLRLLGVYLSARGEPPQILDVLTMLGFIILIGTVVNNAILIVHQSLNYIRSGAMTPKESILEAVRTRIRPIFMTTATTCMGLAPLVFFPGAGAELYRGLGSVVLGGLLISTVFTLVLVPTMFSLMLDLVSTLQEKLGYYPNFGGDEIDESAEREEGPGSASVSSTEKVPHSLDAETSPASDDGDGEATQNEGWTDEDAPVRRPR